MRTLRLPRSAPYSARRTRWPVVNLRPVRVERSRDTACGISTSLDANGSCFQALSGRQHHLQRASFTRFEQAIGLGPFAERHAVADVLLGEAVAQSLALAIDPYLEGPGAEEVRKAGLLSQGESNPFAALKGLLKE